MTEKLPTILTYLLIFIFMGLFANAAVADEVSRVTKEELKSMLGDSQVIVMDVRTAKDWNGSQSKIKDAVREDPKKFTSWADKYDKSKTYVLY